MDIESENLEKTMLKLKRKLEEKTKQLEEIKNRQNGPSKHDKEILSCATNTNTELPRNVVDLSQVSNVIKPGIECCDKNNINMSSFHVDKENEMNPIEMPRNSYFQESEQLFDYEPALSGSLESRIEESRAIKPVEKPGGRKSSRRKKTVNYSQMVHNTKDKVDCAEVFKVAFQVLVADASELPTQDFELPKEYFKFHKKQTHIFDDNSACGSTNSCSTDLSVEAESISSLESPENSFSWAFKEPLTIIKGFVGDNLPVIQEEPENEVLNVSNVFPKTDDDDFPKSPLVTSSLAPPKSMSFHLCENPDQVTSQESIGDTSMTLRLSEEFDELFDKTVPEPKKSNDVTDSFVEASIPADVVGNIEASYDLKGNHTEPFEPDMGKETIEDEEREINKLSNEKDNIETNTNPTDAKNHDASDENCEASKSTQNEANVSSSTDPELANSAQNDNPLRNTSVDSGIALHKLSSANVTVRPNYVKKENELNPPNSPPESLAVIHHSHEYFKSPKGEPIVKLHYVVRDFPLVLVQQKTALLFLQRHHMDYQWEMVHQFHTLPIQEICFSSQVVNYIVILITTRDSPGHQCLIINYNNFETRDISIKSAIGQDLLAGPLDSSYFATSLLATELTPITVYKIKSQKGEISSRLMEISPKPIINILRVEKMYKTMAGVVLNGLILWSYHTGKIIVVIQLEPRIERFDIDWITKDRGLLYCVLKRTQDGKSLLVINPVTGKTQTLLTYECDGDWNETQCTVTDHYLTEVFVKSKLIVRALRNGEEYISLTSQSITATVICNGPEDMVIIGYAQGCLHTYFI